LVYVALNSDAWLVRKKGFCFMPWEERAAILRAMRFVSRVVSVDDDNGSVASAIFYVQPDYFANGGDRTEPNLYEAAACKRVGCKELFGIGGAKVQSSSALVRRAWE
jgi:D-beta-D-heptose 7-phosphate kinase/D-beta-D-heptose 1-phosphate adenosyltransferase